MAVKILDNSCLHQVITSRPKHSHKGMFGKILIIGGNDQMGGAALMSASAAVHAGAGLVTCATALANRCALHASLPEAMFLDYRDHLALATALKRASVIVIGPGLGLDEQAKEALKLTLNELKPTDTLIIDGSAITLCAQNNFIQPKCHVIYTPHQIEWERLSGITLREQETSRNQLAQLKLNAHVVLKKYQTEIYHLDRSISQLNIGGPYMATGGMGDTLTGIIAAFMGQFSTLPFSATLDAAVYTHSALASELAKDKYVVLPTDIISHLQPFMTQFC